MERERDPGLDSSGNNPVEISIHTILTQLGIDVSKWEAFEKEEKRKERQQNTV